MLGYRARNRALFFDWRKTMNSDERRITFKISCDLNNSMRDYIEKRHGTLKVLVVKAIRHALLRCKNEDSDFLSLISYATPRARRVNDTEQIAVHLPVELINRIDSLVPIIGSDRSQFIETSLLSYCNNYYEGFSVTRQYPIMYYERLWKDKDEDLERIYPSNKKSGQ